MYLSRKILISLLIALAMSARMARAQTLPAPATLANVQVKEWTVIIADPYRQHGNSIFAAGSSLPAFVDTLRPAAAGVASSQPSPIGVIRFFGRTDQKVSVRVGSRNGTFYGTWPTAHIRAAEVEWADLTLSSAAERLAPIDPDHWFASLRNTSSYVKTAGWSEQFLLYDVEFPFAMPLKVGSAASSDASVSLSNVGVTPLHDVVIYRHDPQGGWRGGAVDELSPMTPTTQPQEPSTVQFGSIAGDPSAFLMRDWKPRLGSFELDESDLKVIVGMFKTHGLDDSSMTAIFRLDAVDLDRLLPIQITPRPQKVVRLGLVIARDVDPELPRAIDDLIVRLGDPDWRQREAATRALARYGPAADAKLRAALSSRDPEVISRAERLLAASNNR